MINATQKMFLSQSALSHKLKEIENNIGAIVFKRHNKKLLLTDTGELLLEYAYKIISEMEELEHDLMALKTNKKERIAISTECYTSYSWLPNAIKEFKKTNVAIELQLKVEATRKPLHFLDDGKLDIAITEKKPSQPKNYSIEFLFEDEFFLIASTKNELAKTITVEKLKECDLLLYEKEAESSLIVSDYINANKIAFKSINSMQLTEAILEMVSANLAITIMPSWIVTPYLKSKKLMMVKLPLKTVKRKWYAVTQKKTTHLISDFIKCLKVSVNKMN